MTTRKLIAGACLAATLVLPSVPAAAADAAAWWGRKPCDWGEMGTIIWHDTPATDYEEINLCFPRVGPVPPKTAHVTARAGVYFCGATGHYIVWYYDLDGRYHEPVNTCI